MEDIIFVAKNVNGRKKSHLFKKHFLLRNIDFELPAGYIMGIIGKNGAGKTTFFDYIMNEKKSYNGQFLLDGKDIAEDSSWTMDHVGFVSEENHFFRLRTAEQNAEMLGRFYSVFDMDLFHLTMKNANLSTQKNVGKMSRGESMKFQLAFAIAHKPRLLLLDEATAGMDPVYRKDFYRLLRGLLEKEECSVIMSSHLEDDINKQFDFIGCFEDGEFVYFKENELS